MAAREGIERRDRGFRVLITGGRIIAVLRICRSARVEWSYLPASDSLPL